MSEETDPTPKPAKAGEAKPAGWEKLRREGSREGSAEVAFDPNSKRNFNVRADGSIAWHEAPEGFKFDKTGELVPVEVKG